MLTSRWDVIPNRVVAHWINLVLLLALSYVLAFLFADNALAPAFGDPAEMPVNLLIPVAALVAAVAIGLWRLFRTRSEPDDQPEPDDSSTWGEFYYNPDPAVAVPKRSGAGYTLNPASPVSWVIGGIILTLPVITCVLAV